MIQVGTVANSEDLVRDAILRQLYSVHRAARGPSKAAVGIRDLQKALKASHSYKQQDVACNLDYLVQKGWVREVVKERSFQTKQGTTQSAEQIKYKISDVGIDKLQQASLFQRSKANDGINITNIQGVTVVGDGNVVNTKFTDLSRVLTQLRAGIQSSTTHTENDRLAAIADIDALQAQLQKSEPNLTVVGLLWRAIEASVTAAGFADLVEQAAALISPLLQ